MHYVFVFFFFQAEDGIRDKLVTGVQTCALPISLPFSSINTCTVTCPDACALRAIGGYGGCTRCIALPLSTPPEIGACGVGLGGGGGGSSAITTFAGPLEMIWPVAAPGAIGATAFELPLPTIVTTPLRTGGTSLAFDSIVF